MATLTKIKHIHEFDRLIAYAVCEAFTGVETGNANQQVGAAKLFSYVRESQDRLERAAFKSIEDDLERMVLAMRVIALYHLMSAAERLLINEDTDKVYVNFNQAKKAAEVYEDVETLTLIDEVTEIVADNLPGCLFSSTFHLKDGVGAEEIVAYLDEQFPERSPIFVPNLQARGRLSMRFAEDAYIFGTKEEDGVMVIHVAVNLSDNKENRLFQLEQLTKKLSEFSSFSVLCDVVNYSEMVEETEDE